MSHRVLHCVSRDKASTPVIDFMVASALLVMATNLECEIGLETKLYKGKGAELELMTRRYASRSNETSSQALIDRRKVLPSSGKTDIGSGG
jgi:hypothetical protein